MSDRQTAVRRAHPMSLIEARKLARRVHRMSSAYELVVLGDAPVAQERLRLLRARACRRDHAVPLVVRSCDQVLSRVIADLRLKWQCRSRRRLPDTLMAEGHSPLKTVERSVPGRVHRPCCPYRVSGRAVVPRGDMAETTRSRWLRVGVAFHSRLWQSVVSDTYIGVITMAIPPEHRRTDSMRVRLSPSMMDRFDRLAESFGMPPSTLCAFAVISFIQQEEATARLRCGPVPEAERQRAEAVLGGADGPQIT